MKIRLGRGQIVDVPRWLPGEAEAVETVKALGAQFGYGNLIHHLKDAWSAHLQQSQGFPKDVADEAGGHVCPWCHVDSRTGKAHARRS